MSHDLTGRVALVTGASRGIGRAIAIRLAGDGASVAVNYRRDHDAARETVDAIVGAGGRAVAYAASVDDVDAVDSMVSSVLDDFGFVDILVHNAGIASRGRSVADTDADEVLRVVTTHALAPHQLTRRLLPQMRQRERGDVIMISSVATGHPRPNGAPYVMGKAALEALAMTLAQEERPNGIRVNVVAPALTATDMGDRLALAVSGVERADQLDATMPFGRVARPDDVANVVAFLVSNDASYLSGQRICVDGAYGEFRRPT